MHRVDSTSAKPFKPFSVKLSFQVIKSSFVSEGLNLILTAPLQIPGSEHGERVPKSEGVGVEDCQPASCGGVGGVFQPRRPIAARGGGRAASQPPISEVDRATADEDLITKGKRKTKKNCERIMEP